MDWASQKLERTENSYSDFKNKSYVKKQLNQIPSTNVS